MSPHLVRLTGHLLSAAVITAAAAPLVAQGSTGKLEGIVRDSLSARPVAAARITILGTTRAALTDSLGRYRFDSLPAGRYDLRAARPGYRAREIRGLRVMSRQTVTQDVTLAEVAVEIEGPLFRRIN